MYDYFHSGEEDERTNDLPNPDPHPDPPVEEPNDPAQQRAPGKGKKIPHKAPGEGMPHPMGDPRQRKI